MVPAGGRRRRRAAPVLIAVLMTAGPLSTAVSSGTASARPAPETARATRAPSPRFDDLQDGYWEVAADGGVFAHGSAPFEGSLGGVRLARPIVGMAADSDSDGYWLVASDG